MRTKNVGLMWAVGCSFLFLCSCLESPTLDTTSSASYKQTLQKMNESQKDEQARLLLASSISSVATEGKEWSLKDSNKGYEFYDILSVLGGAGRLMPLNGKNADEILALGYAAREKWVAVNIPPRIESVQQEIDKLKAKKLHAEKIADTEKLFELKDVTLTPKEALESGSKKPLGGVASFVITGKGSNKGSVPVYGCDLIMTIIDTKKQFVHCDAQTFVISFSPPVAPGGIQEFHKEVSVWDWRSTPYEMNRYSLQYTLKSTNASSKETGLFSADVKFDSYDESNLAKCENELVELTATLKQFSK